MDIPAEINPSIQSLDLFKIIEDSGNLYKMITIVGKRSNQISVKLKHELTSKLADFASTNDSLEEIVENREQIEIAKHYEQLPKPTLIAIYEFQNNKLEWEDNSGI